MKRIVTTDKRSHELTKTEIRKLNQAQAIVDELAFFYRNTPNGDRLQATADDLDALANDTTETGADE